MNTDRQPNGFAKGWLLAALGAALLFIWWPGCRQYPEATSAEGMTLIKLAYSATNSKSPQRLKLLEARLQKARTQGLLSKAEDDAFQSIIESAKRGDWKEAEQASFRFAKDQVRR